MSGKVVVKVTCELEVPFFSYEKKSLDKEAERQIKRWIKDALAGDVVTEGIRYIPLFVEKDEDGELFDDSTGRVKLKVY